MVASQYRVLLICLSSAFGGAEVRVLTQANALQGLVASCRIAVLENSPLHKRAVSEGLAVEVVAYKRSDPRLLFALYRIIRQGHYNIIDAHNVQSIFWGHLAALLARAKGRVATIHSDYGREYPGLKGKFYEAVLWLNRFIAKHAIHVTDVLYEKALRRGKTDHNSLIYNAIPIPPAPYQRHTMGLRTEFGYTDTDFIIASIARLKPVKGHKYLIEAFAYLRDLPHVKLLIVGEGPLHEALGKQIADLQLQEPIQMAGFREDIPEILKMVDCVCMSSLSEALPYTLLEAAAYARPLIATKVGGMASLLEDGKTAVMVPAQDAHALANAIRYLVEHPTEATQIGLAAYTMVQASFSVDTMIEHILNVYRKALD